MSLLHVFDYEQRNKQKDSIGKSMHESDSTWMNG